MVSRALHVAVTGAQGEIAEACRGAMLSVGWKVTAVRRGDDPADAARHADHVLVLDGDMGNAPAYRMALQALSHALRDVDDLRHVVAITPQPKSQREHDGVGRRFREAEDDARAAGLHLTVVRYGLLVGTPTQRGPSDGSLFVDHVPLVVVPGDGEQTVRPLLIEDFAQVVLVALSQPAEDHEPILVEGPETMTVNHLTRCLNSDSVRVARFRPSVARWMPAVWLLASLFPFLALTLPAAVDVWLLGVATALWVAALIAGDRVQRAQRSLPGEDWVLAEGDGERQVFGVPLRKISEVWGRAGRDKRRQQRDLRRSLRRYRAHEAAPLVATFFVALGLTGFVIGAHDALFVPTLGARLSGTALALAGLVTAVGGASLLLVGWAGRYVIAFVGGVVATLTLVVMVLAAVVNGDPSVWTVLAGYLAAAAVWSCFLLARRGGAALVSFIRKHGYRTATSLAVGGALAFAGQFLYETLYVPTTATPTVSLQAELKEGTAHGGRVPLATTIRLMNPTPNSVNVLGSFWVVEVSRATRVTPPAAGRLDRVEGKWERMLATQGRIRGYARLTDTVVVDHGNLGQAGTFLEPGEEIQRRFVVLAPRVGDVATLSVHLVVARRRFQTPKPYSPAIEQVPGQRFINTVTQIEDPSLIHRVTRSKRYIHGVVPVKPRRLAACEPQGLHFVYIDNDAATDLDKTCALDSARLDTHYGMTVAETVSELALKQGG